LTLILGANAQAYEHRCFESATNAKAKGRDQYAIIVTEVDDINSPRSLGDYDAAYRVSVVIQKRDPRSRSRFADHTSFEGVAKMKRTRYELESEVEGVSFNIWLDERDATLRLRGVSGPIGMKCR
jgi:hypothetical protein